jgi:hypothetical protein
LPGSPCNYAAKHYLCVCNAPAGCAQQSPDIKPRECRRIPKAPSTTGISAVHSKGGLKPSALIHTDELFLVNRMSAVSCTSCLWCCHAALCSEHHGLVTDYLAFKGCCFDSCVAGSVPAHQCQGAKRARRPCTSSSRLKQCLITAEAAAACRVHSWPAPAGDRVCVQHVSGKASGWGCSAAAVSAGQVGQWACRGESWVQGSRQQVGVGCKTRSPRHNICQQLHSTMYVALMKPVVLHN